MVGKVLIAINPYKTIEDIYSNEKKSVYRNEIVHNLPPHLYTIGK